MPTRPSNIDADKLYGLLEIAKQKMQRADDAVDRAMAKGKRKRARKLERRAYKRFEKVYDIKDIFEDPYFTEREDIVSVPDEQLGRVRMQGIIPKLPNYDLKISHAGVARGHDNDEVFGRLGLSQDEIKQLAADGIV